MWTRGKVHCVNPTGQEVGFDHCGVAAITRTFCVLVKVIWQYLGVRDPVSAALSEMRWPYLLSLAKRTWIALPGRLYTQVVLLIFLYQLWLRNCWNVIKTGSPSESFCWVSPFRGSWNSWGSSGEWGILILWTADGCSIIYGSHARCGRAPSRYWGSSSSFIPL